MDFETESRGEGLESFLFVFGSVSGIEGCGGIQLSIIYLKARPEIESVLTCDTHSRLIFYLTIRCERVTSSEALWDMQRLAQFTSARD